MIAGEPRTNKHNINSSQLCMMRAAHSSLRWASCQALGGHYLLTRWHHRCSRCPSGRWSATEVLSGAKQLCDCHDLTLHTAQREVAAHQTAA